jgi:hypothetical protein
MIGCPSNVRDFTTADPWPIAATRNQRSASRFYVRSKSTHISSAHATRAIKMGMRLSFILWRSPFFFARPGLPHLVGGCEMGSGMERAGYTAHSVNETLTTG